MTDENLTTMILSNDMIYPQKFFKDIKALAPKILRQMIIKKRVEKILVLIGF